MSDGRQGVQRVFRVGLNAWSLGIDASTLLAHAWRSWPLGGEPASREALLMIAEKVRADMELQSSIVGAMPLGGTED